MKNSRRKFSRRRFLTLGTIGTAGVWAGSSNQAVARALRELVAETHRPILRPPLTPQPQSWLENGITVAWLGHSSVLLNFYGVTILTDPVLFNRVGANTCMGTIGAKRLIAPALKPSQLPTIDLVLLSHAHMDHLDFHTIDALPARPQAVMASAMDDLLRHTKLRSPKALGWGERKRICTRSGDLEIRAFEVKHWGARWRYDKFRGYNGYVIEREGKRILFGGDTAWIESFRALRSQGPFELAIMPIGAYRPWVCSHCTPEEAVRMADGAGARYFAPVHFKTFPFGREGSLEPLERLTRTIEPDRITWRDVGETFRVV